MPESPVDLMAEARVGHRLAEVRRKRFVGRRTELELFRSALAEEEPPFNLLFVHGPGGIGKTALLEQYARLGAEAGRPVLRLDGHDILPTSHGFSLALSQALALAEGEDPVSALSRLGDPVLLVDTFEALQPIEDWVRSHFLPLLPARTLAVFAGRNAPTEAWRSDPGWSELSRVISLRNLRPEESRQLLAARGVAVERHEDILRFTHGHPLALSLAAEVMRSGAADLATAGWDVLAPLVRRFVADAPSPLHRQALEALSVAYRTTEATLGTALGLRDEPQRAHELFQWLSGLSAVEHGQRGLFPHDIVRDAIFEDLQRRHPEQLRTLSRRIARVEWGRFLSSQGPDRHAAFWGTLYVRRHFPSMAPFYDWTTMGQAFAQPARPEDREQVLAMVERHEGEESAAVAARWFQHQRQAFHVFRSLRDELTGFACHLLVDAEVEADAFDPALAAIREYIRRRGPLRPGERVSVHRYWMGREDYQSATAHNTTAPTAVAQWVSVAGLAWSFIVLRDTDFWAPTFEFVGFQRAEGADFALGPHRYGFVAHDWRAVPPRVWWEQLGRRFDDPGQQPLPEGRPGETLVGETLVVLSQPEFGDAVRRAYHEYTRPDALATNPLARSRLVLEGSSSRDAGAVLQALLREAAQSLRGHPRDEKLYRALWHTYIEPAPTQEAAAELLDLPFSTYRRHLRAGLERATEWLWLRELYGSGSD